MSNESAAANILKSNRYLTLATVGSDGPWASPLAYTIEPDSSLVFYSARDSRHCENISHNPQVSGAVFDSREPSDTADGVQFVGTVEEVSDADLARVMERYFRLSFPDPEVRARWNRPEGDFKGQAPQRYYRIKIDRIYKPDPTSTLVDRRVEIDFNTVHALLSNS
ncbi:MAG TPA: pyridoxamine 5'-phosphate oxidase family protein [Allosphingosinicella sp.]|jgi:nitroimidazol reductase NimA-like FMN-containing flavoprotein (pyridoxamine 5'-phosphate oxidase superfamily)